MNLYFLRHGVAVEPDQWSGRDFERPLTGEGIARMEREARGIAKLVPDLEAIVTSPLLRALQTARIVAQRFELRGEPIVDERLGIEFGVEKLTAILQEARDAETIVLVGHEPSFGLIVGRLIGRADVEIKKGALAGVWLENARSTSGRLFCLIPPKALIKLGKG